jgi:hypothetical protein
VLYVHEKCSPLALVGSLPPTLIKQIVTTGGGGLGREVCSFFETEGNISVCHEGNGVTREIIIYKLSQQVREELRKRGREHG